MVAVIFYSPLLFQTRVAHITAEGNITHEVHITRRRRIELAHLLYRRCANGFCFLFYDINIPTGQFRAIYGIILRKSIPNVEAVECNTVQKI